MKNKRFIVHALANTVLIFLALLIDQRLILIPTVYICILILSEKEIDKKFIYLCYFIPFSGVIKLSPASISLYTIIQTAYLVSVLMMMLVKRIKIYTDPFLLIALFIGYVVTVGAANSVFSLVVMLNVLSWYLIMYSVFFFKTEYSPFIYTTYYMLGVIVSCVVALFKEQVPRMGDYIHDTSIWISTSSSEARFSGLWNDPNTFSTFILVALALLAINYRFKYYSRWFYLPASALSIFGLMSYSKMLLIGVVVFWLIIVFLERKHLTKVMIALFSLGAVIFIIDKLFPVIFEVYTFRIEDIFSTQTSLDSVTTGRTTIWGYYLESLINTSKWIFGNGIGAVRPRGRAAHNIIIEMIYAMGIVGVALYVAMLRSISKIKTSHAKTKDHLFKRLPLMVLLIGAMSLDLFMFDYFSVLLTLSLLCLNVLPGEEVLRRETIGNRSGI